MMLRFISFLLLLVCLWSCTETATNSTTEPKDTLATKPVESIDAQVQNNNNATTTTTDNPVAQFLAKLPEVSALQDLEKNIRQTAKHQSLELTELPNAPTADDMVEELTITGAGKYTFANGWVIYALCQFMKYEGEPGWNTTTLTIVDEEYSKIDELEVENMSESAAQSDYTSLQKIEEDGTAGAFITINKGSANYKDDTDEGMTILYAIGESGKFEKRTETAYSN